MGVRTAFLGFNGRNYGTPERVALVFDLGYCGSGVIFIIGIAGHDEDK
jgi:hypothetical protein